MSIAIAGAVDSPDDAIEVSQKRLLVQGWAYADDGDDIAVSAEIDNGKCFMGKWGLARFDVFENRGDERAYESGFYIELKLPEVFNRKLQIKVFAERDDTRVVLGEFQVTRREKPNRKIRKAEQADVHKFQFVPAGPAGSIRRSRKWFLQVLQSRGGLKCDSAVLEIGPGIGRFALPVTRLVQGGGYYRGLEILPQAVRHCNYHIGSRYDNCQVSLVDVNNRMYNKFGQLDAREYRFPYDSGEFDLVYLQSVFTHMMFPDVENYIHEISRTLKAGGRCVATFFLLNDDTRRRIANATARRTFAVKDGATYTDNPDKPEAATAFEESLVRKTFAANGLEILEPVEYGSWRGVKARMTQDMMVVCKPS